MQESCKCDSTLQTGGQSAPIWPDPSSTQLPSTNQLILGKLDDLLQEQITSNQERQDQLDHIDNDLHVLTSNLQGSQQDIQTAITSLQTANTSENADVLVAIQNAETANSTALTTINGSISALNTTTATTGANTVAAIQSAESSINNALAVNTAALATLQASNEQGLDDVVTAIQTAQNANTTAFNALQSSVVTELQNIFNAVTPISRNHITNRLAVPYTIPTGAQAFSIASVNKQDFIVNGQTVPGDLIYQGHPLADNDTYPTINCSPAIGDELVITETR